MDQCEECQRLWNTYQAATTQAVELDVEARSTTENQGLRSSKQEPEPKLPSRNESRLAKGWRNIKQPGIGESARFIGPAKAAQLRGVVGLAFPPGFPMAAHSL